MKHYLCGNETGISTYGECPENGTPPPGGVICSQSQFQNWQQLVIVNGEIVAAPDSVLLQQAQSAQIALVTQGYNTATNYVPVTINGTTYQVDNTPSKQALNLSLTITANGMLSAPAWAASTEYSSTPATSYCAVNGVILFCSTAGESGASAPTPPTTFGTPVTDGTCQWELLGRKVYLQGGGFVLMTPQQIMEAFQQGELYLHQMSDQLESLNAQIMAATTVSAVQAIVWP